MASQKQIEANRRNGEKGGPRTRSGKARSRMNARKHGLRAETVVLPGEDPEEFNFLYQCLREHHQPIGPEEELLVERIAIENWLLKRATQFETGILLNAYQAAEEGWKAKKAEKGKVARDLLARVDFILKRAEEEERRFRPEAEEGPCPEENDATNQGPEDQQEDETAEDQQEDEAAEGQQEDEAAEGTQDVADEDPNKPLRLLGDAYLRSAQDIEKLSRYVTAIATRLRNAIRDIERAQARRMSEAADSASVIEGRIVEKTEAAHGNRQSKTPNSADVINISANRTESEPKRKSIPRVRVKSDNQ